jgi:hypothetical protein
MLGFTMTVTGQIGNAFDNTFIGGVGPSVQLAAPSGIFAHPQFGKFLYISDNWGIRILCMSPPSLDEISFLSYFIPHLYSFHHFSYSPSLAPLLFIY